MFGINQTCLRGPLNASQTIHVQGHRCANPQPWQNRELIVVRGQTKRPRCVSERYQRSQGACVGVLAHTHPARLHWNDDARARTNPGAACRVIGASRDQAGARYDRNSEVLFQRSSVSQSVSENTFYGHLHELRATAAAGMLCKRRQGTHSNTATANYPLY